MKHPLSRLFDADALNDADGLQIFKLLAPIGIWFGVSDGLKKEMEVLSGRLSEAWSPDLIGAIGAWQMAAEGRNVDAAFRFFNSTNPARAQFKNFCSSTSASAQSPYGHLRLFRRRQQDLQKVFQLTSNLKSERIWQEIQDQGFSETIEKVTKQFGIMVIDSDLVINKLESKLHSAGVGRRQAKPMITRVRELLIALSEISEINSALKPLEADWPKKFIFSESALAGADNLTAFLAQPLSHNSRQPDPLDLANAIMAQLETNDTNFMARISDLVAPLLEDQDVFLRMNELPMGQIITSHIIRKKNLSEDRDDLANRDVDVDYIDLFLEENELDQATQEIKRLQSRLKEDLELEKLADQLETRSKLVQGDARFSKDKEMLKLLSEATRFLKERSAQDVKNALQALVVLMSSVDIEKERMLVSDKVLELEDLYPSHPVASSAREILEDENIGFALLTKLQDIRTTLVDAISEIRGRIDSDFGKELDEIESLLQNPGLSSDAREEGQNRKEWLQETLEKGQLSNLVLEEARSLKDTLARRISTTWTFETGEKKLLEQVEEYIQSHAVFPSEDIRRLFLALKTKPFVLLAGMTGSGKSTLARLMAESLGATKDSFRRIAVRPDWIDQSESLGFINPLSNEFQPGWLAQIMRKCETSPDRLFFVLLDEMNLAPVEQYLADALSSMEEQFQGSERAETPLYLVGNPNNGKEWPESMPWPENLFIIGTVNIDETTRALSERVLDRSSLIQIVSKPGRRHHEVQRVRDASPANVPYSEWVKMCADIPTDKYHDFLDELTEILMEMRIGLGSRTHNYIELFMDNSVEVFDETNALDFVVLQRVIPKIRGYKYLLRGLPQLQILLEEYELHRCVAVLVDWNSPETSDDAFLDGTDPKIGLVAHYGE